MRRIQGPELELVLPYFEAAAEVAKEATCLRAKCGSVIVASDGEIIGRGYNAPPLGDETQRTCNEVWDYTKKPKFDLTCCVHAEWNSCIDALRNHPNKIGGSALYFMRIDENGGFTGGGEPYCTTCSRFTMQTGVAEFALWDEKTGTAKIWALPDYNTESYQYFEL